MLFHFFIWISDYPARADKSAVGAINRPLRLSRVSEYPARADKSATSAVQISQRIIMKEECSETTLFRTTEEDALRVYYRKPDTIICCSLWRHINDEHNAYPGQHNPNQDRFFGVPCR